MSDEEEDKDESGSQAAGPSNAPGSNSLTCARCLKVFKYRAWYDKHVVDPPASCVQEQIKLRRNALPRPEASHAVSPDLPLHIRLARFRTLCFLPDHIPKSTSRQVAQALVGRLDIVIERNDAYSWTSLLTFSFDTLGQPRVEPSMRKASLPQIIRRNLRDGYCAQSDEAPNSKPALTSKRDEEAVIQRKAARKFADGDISGVVKALLTEETLLNSSPETLAALASKHPKGAPITSLPPDPDSPVPSPISPEEVQEAVDGFPNGSAAGSDGLRPQYLKELLASLRGVDRDNLCRSLAAVGDIMLLGKAPDSILPVLYGANLFAFRKKDGGVRPIAVGLTLRRLVARIVARRLRILGEELRPVQLGFATPGGVEAAAHAARTFMEANVSSPSAKVFLKLDVRNAFNTLDRSSLLNCVRGKTPEYYPFVWQNYAAKSFLMYGERVILSETGVQQGDPLGPVWYCLVTAPLHRGLSSELVESFLDDDALGGTPACVIADFETLTTKSREVGLELNVEKCELFATGGTINERNQIYEDFLKRYPNLSRPPPERMVYLGAPLVDDAVPEVLEKHIQVVTRLGHRLALLPSHQALYLLARCVGSVKLLYTLRTSRCYRFTEHLVCFDKVVEECLERITNVQLEESSAQQASLPVSKGGLGIRRTAELAASAFLASAHSVRQLSSSLLDFDVASYTQDAETQWNSLSHTTPPSVDLASSQKAWDLPIIEACTNKLQLLTAGEPTAKARLKALQRKEANAWLRALPAASLGNLLDDGTLRLAVAARLGAKVGEPHRCVCGGRADVLGHHALSCKLSAGRQRRHKGFNEIVARSLVTADQLCELEPLGLSDVDGKRPDGITITPWLRGKCLFWDATCTCTVAISHVAGTTKEAGSAAKKAEARKKEKYEHLTNSYLFAPVAIETFGPWGPDTTLFLTQLGQKMARTSGDQRSMDFLRQRLSIELQRSNAACILGTVPPSGNLDEIYGVVRPRKVCSI